MANLAALRAAVFPYLRKTLRGGGGGWNQSPAGARVKLVLVYWKDATFEKFMGNIPDIAQCQECCP